MEIKRLNISELESYINSEEYKTSEDIPISRHRALSYINHPDAKTNDIVLCLAYIDGRLMGYLGILPGYLKLYDIHKKVGWLSCLWVSPNARGKGIAKVLVKEALQAWDYKVLATEFTPEAKNLYDRSGEFEELYTATGVRGFLRFNLQELLPNRFPKLSGFKDILKAVDYTGNALVNMGLLFSGQKTSKNYTIEYLSYLDEETTEYINSWQRRELLCRDADELNWITRYPWVLNACTEDKNTKRYYFTSIAKRFNLLNIKLLDENENIIAFIMLSVRNNNLKIPYCFVEEKDVSKVLEVIYLHMHKMKLNMFTTYHPLLTKYINKSSTPFIYKRDIRRTYLATHSLKSEIENFNTNSKLYFQDGDGDCAFT